MSSRKPRAGGSSVSGASTPASTLKRARSSADLQDRSSGPKRKASDPFSFDDDWSDSPDAGIDIIDLTGDDVDEVAALVAKQITDNYKQKLEQRELKALSSPVTTLPEEITSLYGAAPPAAGDDAFVLGVTEGENVLGARSPAKPLSSNPPPHLPPPFSLVQQHPGSSGSSDAPQLPSQPVRQVLGALVPNNQSSIPGSSAALALAPQMPPTGLRAGPSSLSPSKVAGGGSLADVINKTALFDYVTGRDEFGNLLPDRLLDYINDEDDLLDNPISDQELDELLNNIRPDLELHNKDVDNTPAGLKTPLYRHQSVALTWMKKMEEGSNRGGILADDMGLGKTVSMIALMLSRQVTSRTKTSLVIAPLSLVRQWEEEIRRKTESSHRFSILVYHNKKIDIDEILKFDVVLTTYGTMASEYGRLQEFRARNENRLIDYSDSSIRYRFPLLHPGKAKFYRVILDEAQCIKNRKTKTALACHQLEAVHRWCLTGTPMMNGVIELFSLLRFLRIKPYSNWAHFRAAFKHLMGKGGHSKHTAMHKLRAILKAVMLRRKKDSILDGKPILQLPKKTEEVVYVELSKDERDFYDQLEKKSQVQFSKYLRDNSIGLNYSQVLVLLLRMRQACCHPHLNLDVQDFVATLTSETEMLEVVRKLDEAIISRIKELHMFECPICYDYVACPSFFGQCGHMSCAQCLIRLVDGAQMENLRVGEESAKVKCPVCRAEFDSKKCFTYDIFQKAHMPEEVKAEEEDEVEDFRGGLYDGWSSSDSETDDDTGSDVDEKGNLKDFIVDDDDDDSDYKPERKEKSKRARRRAQAQKSTANIKPSMLRTLRKEAAKNRESYRKYMTYLRQTWLPSAKVSECIKLVQQAAADGEKIIVFSQWTLLLDLIQVGLKHEKLRSELRRYDGSMTGEQRFESAQEFRDNKKVTAMLVSLRAGNAGLNLTAASRVVIMDPFWNPYVERQAVDRAHRIGQHKEVTVYRLLTRNTVEDRIVLLQKKKEEMVEAALDEAEGVRISRLGVQQLKFLFNTT